MKLFERRGSLGMVPTSHAIELAETARTLLEKWSYATNLTKMKGNERPYVSINGPSLFMEFVFAPLWAKSKLSTQYLMHCQTFTAIDVALNISGQETDAAFLFDKTKAMDMKFIPICTEQAAVIYNVDAKVELSDLMKKSNDGLSWLSYRPDGDPLSLLIQSKMLPKKKIVGYFEDLSALLNIVSQDPRYATVLPYHSVLFNKEKLRGLPLPGTDNEIFFVYRPQGDRQADLKEFGEFMAQELKDHPLFTIPRKASIK